MEILQEVQSETFQFLQLSCHTPGWTPLSLENLLKNYVPKNGQHKSFEMTVQESNSRKLLLPSGVCAQWRRDPA